MSDDLESWEQPPDDPDATKQCGGCGGTLAWAPDAEEWYHEDSVREIEAELQAITETLDGLEGDEAIKLDGKTGAVYAQRLDADEYRVRYAALGLTERENRPAVRTLMQARDWTVVPLGETPLDAVELASDGGIPEEQCIECGDSVDGMIWETFADGSEGWLCPPCEERILEEHGIAYGGTDASTTGSEHTPTLSHKGVDEISLSEGPYVFLVDGFGVEETDERADHAERAGEDVTILFPRGGRDGW